MTENVTQNTFGDRLADLTEAIAAALGPWDYNARFIA